MSEEKFLNDSEDLNEDKKTTKRTTKKKTSATETVDKEKISKQLNAIYKDEDGKIPDMRHISRAGSQPFFAGIFKFLFSLALILVLGWGGFMFINASKNYSDSQVDLKIIGPENYTIGATTTYQIVIKNNKNITLNNLGLQVSYPSGFNFIDSSMPPNNAGKTAWSIEKINGDEEQTIQITGKIFSSVSEQKSFEVALSYTPENVNSELVKKTSLTLSAQAAPIDISISGLSEVAIGNEVPYTVTISSKDGRNLEDLSATPVLPTNFVITTSSLALKDGSFLLLASTSTPLGTSKYTFSFSGKFTTTTSESENIKIQIKMAGKADNLVIGESTLETKIVQNALALNTAVNGSITNINSAPGDTLNFSLSIKNFSKTDISKASLKLTVDVPAIKKQSVISWNEIKDKYDADVVGSQVSDSIRRATIIWNENKNKEMTKIKSGSEVNISFSVPIKDSDNFDWGQIKENQILIASELSFSDTAGAHSLTGNSLTINLSSNTRVEVKDKTATDDKGRENHQISWTVYNSFHPLKNVVLSADLYGNVVWIGPSSTPAGTINYDEKTKRLTWSIPAITENTDVLSVPFSITIMKKDPTQSELVSKIKFSAEDSISGQKIELIGDSVKLK